MSETGLSRDAILLRFRRSGVRDRQIKKESKRNENDWTEEEITILNSMKGKTIEDVEKSLSNRSRDAILQKIVRLGGSWRDYVVGERHVMGWSSVEDDIVRKNYDSSGASLVVLQSLLPGRTRRAIGDRASQLGVAFKRCKYQRHKLSQNYSKNQVDLYIR